MMLGGLSGGALGAAADWWQWRSTLAAAASRPGGGDIVAYLLNGELAWDIPWPIVAVCAIVGCAAIALLPEKSTRSE